MIFEWEQRRLAGKALIDGDATELMQEFGDGAYRAARDRALAARRGDVIDANRDAHHWDQVRAEIGRRTKRHVTDTATRYVEDRDRSA
jgi:hypothetical protein